MGFEGLLGPAALTWRGRGQGHRRSFLGASGRGREAPGEHGADRVTMHTGQGHREGGGGGLLSAPYKKCYVGDQLPRAGRCRAVVDNGMLGGSMEGWFQDHSLPWGQRESLKD